MKSPINWKSETEEERVKLRYYYYVLHVLGLREEIDLMLINFDPTSTTILLTELLRSTFWGKSAKHNNHYWLITRNKIYTIIKRRGEDANKLLLGLMDIK